MQTVEINNETHIAHQQKLLTLLKEFDRICKALDIPYMLFAGTMLGAVRHQGFIPWDDDLDIIMLRKDYDRFLAQADNLLDKEKFYLQKEFSAHWPMFFSKLRLNNTTCLEKFHPKDAQLHQGIYIDLFPCDNASDSLLGRKIQFIASKIVIAKSLTKRGYETFDIKKKVFMLLCRFLPAAPFVKIVKKGGKHSEYVHSFFGAASSFSKNVYPRKWLAETDEVQFEDGYFPVSRYYDELLRVMYGDYMQLPSLEERKLKQHVVLIDFEKSYENYREQHNEMQFDVLTRSIR